MPLRAGDPGEALCDYQIGRHVTWPSPDRTLDNDGYVNLEVPAAVVLQLRPWRRSYSRSAALLQQIEPAPWSWCVREPCISSEQHDIE